jgi:hypothetical protein
LGLRAEDCEPPGIASSIVKLMVDEGELEKGDGYHPSYTLPGGQAKQK